MSSTTKKDYITFAKGINTEVNFIKEEEGTCSELSNFKIEKDGSIKKRGGLLPTQTIIPSINSNDKPQHYLWENINGNPEDNFYVIKQGLTLFFFKATSNLDIDNKLNMAVDLAGHTTLDYTDGDSVIVEMVDGDGYLFVVGRKIEPLIIKYDKEAEVMEVKEIEVTIRDYVGLEDNIVDDTEYPLTLTDQLSYNLTNQGFREDDIAQYFADNGYLPAKVDVPQYFKYTRVSTDLDEEDYEPPKEITDYQLSFENNFGTSKAPIGRNLLNVFKQDRKIRGSKVIYNVNPRNIFGVRLENQAMVITFKTNRLPDLPLNTALVPNFTQTGTEISFPTAGYPDTQLGFPMTRYVTPMVVTWDRKDTFIEYLGLFQNPDGAPWGAYETMTEAEYQSYSLIKNNYLFARNLGETNEYVIIYDNDNTGDYVKDNLADIEGEIIEEFLLSSSWDLEDDEKGTYLRIVTNANNDNLYNQRQISYVKTPRTYPYTYWTTTQSGEVIEVTDILPPQWVNSVLKPAAMDGFISPTGAFIKYISDDLAELWVGDSLDSIDDSVETLPQGYNSWRWNTVKEDGYQLQSLTELLGQMTIEYIISEDDVDISKDEELTRPQSIAFFANRAFYSTYQTDLFSNHIFFSQMEDLYNNAGKCYMTNDPTSEFQNGILATDGGYLTLPEADNILDLVVVKDKLVALCNNSVYAIYGSPYFKATSYGVKKIADVGIAAKGCYTIVGETIVFAGYEGLYSFNIEEQNGNLISTNFSNEKIKSFYNSLTKEQKENIKIDYNNYDKTLQILLNKNNNLTPDTYDTVLIYDFDLEAFYMYDIDQYEDLQILDFFNEYFYNKDKPNSFLYYDNITGGYGTLSESKDTYKDFDISNPDSFPCSLESNYINFEDVMRMKAVKMLEVWTNNEDNNFCEAFVKYDSSVLGTKKWSKPENIYRLQPKTNGLVHVHQQMCRGNGLFFKLRFESNQDKPCHIIGWSLTVTGNNQI